MIRCRICSNGENNRLYSVREMMFGLREVFDYMECGRCGCLQICEIPASLQSYYGDGYYSFAEPRRGPLKSYLKRERSRFSLSGKGLLGRALSIVYGDPLAIRWAKEWRDHAGVGPDCSVLDVGCGRGSYFHDLVDVGFTRLHGIDPFLDADVHIAGNVKILKKDLSDVNEAYDFVVLNHSFEHLPDPRAALRDISRVLAPEGFALIRTPVVPSYAWRTYGVDWAQLDAPRHLHLHSRRSIELLAQESGFAIAGVVYDSDEFQFWGSEQYRRDIPLVDPRSYAVDRSASLFTKKEILSFRERAAELNRGGDGDSAGFYLFKNA